MLETFGASAVVQKEEKMPTICTHYAHTFWVYIHLTRGYFPPYDIKHPLIVLALVHTHVCLVLNRAAVSLCLLLCAATFPTGMSFCRTSCCAFIALCYSVWAWRTGVRRRSYALFTPSTIATLLLPLLPASAVYAQSSLPSQLHLEYRGS